MLKWVEDVYLDYFLKKIKNNKYPYMSNGCILSPG